MTGQAVELVDLRSLRGRVAFTPDEHRHLSLLTAYTIWMADNTESEVVDDDALLAAFAAEPSFEDEPPSAAEIIRFARYAAMISDAFEEIQSVLHGKRSVREVIATNLPSLVNGVPQ